MFDTELTLLILNNKEQILGFLHPKYVDVTESNTFQGLRSLQITHSLFDDKKKDLNHYNNLLKHGNKVWFNQSPDGNGCLYVLLDDKTVDPSKNTVVITGEEVATELASMPPIRLSSTSRTINADWINTNIGLLFTAGTVESITLNYTGVIGLMALLRLITKNTSKEIQFRYQYDPDTNIINRYIDILTLSGKTHQIPVEIGYNTDNILLEETEATTAIAAAPIGTPSDQTSKNITDFNNIHQAFEDLIIDPSVQIPSIVTKDSNQNDVNGPMVYPPYSKSAGSLFVQCPPTDSAANYSQIQEQQGQNSTHPRTILFTSNETNKYNIYWDCVTQIKKSNQPTIVLTTTVMDIQKMKGNTPEYYNAGDTVYIKMPGRVNRVKARVTKTTKNPRQPDKDKIEIGNYNLNFFIDYLDINMDNFLPYQ